MATSFTFSFLSSQWISCKCLVGVFVFLQRHTHCLLHGHFLFCQMCTSSVYCSVCCWLLKSSIPLFVYLRHRQFAIQLRERGWECKRNAEHSFDHLQFVSTWSLNRVLLLISGFSCLFLLGHCLIIQLCLNVLNCSWRRRISIKTSPKPYNWESWMTATPNQFQLNGEFSFTWKQANHMAARISVYAAEFSSKCSRKYNGWLVTFRWNRLRWHSWFTTNCVFYFQKAIDSNYAIIFFFLVFFFSIAQINISN